MAITAGGSLNLVPAPDKQALQTNYLDLASGTTDWAQQFVPDLMEKGILSNRDFDKMCYNGQIEYEKCEETDFINMTEKERNIELQNRAYNKGDINE